MKQQRDLILQIVSSIVLGMGIWIFNTNTKVEVLNVKYETSLKAQIVADKVQAKELARVKEDMDKSNKIIEKNTDAFHRLELVIGKLIERLK